MCKHFDLTATQAHKSLSHILLRAYSGELAAAHAYHGHWQSVRCAQEKEKIKAIEKEELEHRLAVGQILKDLNVQPEKAREIYMTLIGLSIALLCRFGGWFIPMYGAGKLEFGNVAEYEHAARYAWLADLPQYVDALLEMAEVEWDHESYFHTKIKQHWLYNIAPIWGQLPPRSQIRSSFNTFCEKHAEILTNIHQKI